MDVATNRQVVPKLRMKGDIHPFLNLFYRCTVHFDICKVHTATNALVINLDSFEIYTKNHFDLLLHISVYDHHQGAFTRA